MRLLFLSRWFPYPADNGSKIRVYNLLKALAERHDVDLLSFSDKPVEEYQVREMQQICSRVETLLYRPFQPSSSKALAGLLALQPRSVTDTFQPEFRQRAEDAMVERAHDVVIASQVDMIPYANHLPVTRILEEIELTQLFEQASREKSLLQKTRRSLMWWKWLNYMTTTLKSMDGCTVVSEQERQRVCRITRSQLPVQVIPNGVDFQAHQGDYGLPSPDTLVFSGALTYHANFDAMQYFLGEIFPLIQAKRPQVRVFITGRTDGVAMDRLPVREGVVFTGYVDDVRPVVANAWVSIAPLRLGGGTRLKILESLALGTPVVSTTKGVEGLDLRPEQDLLVVDDPQDFASSVLRLLQDNELRQRISHAGRRTVADLYDWSKIGPKFCDFIEKVALEGLKA